MKAKPDKPEDWRALAKRQAVLLAAGLATLFMSMAEKRLAASDLGKQEKAAEVENAQVIGWESFDMMIRYYEDRVEALEKRLQGCEEVE